LFLPVSEVYRHREYYLGREVSVQGWLAIGRDFYPDYVIASYAFLTTLEEGRDAWDRGERVLLDEGGMIEPQLDRNGFGPRGGGVGYYGEDALVTGTLVRAHPRRYRLLRAWEKVFPPQRRDIARVIRRNLCDPLRCEYVLTDLRYCKVFRTPREMWWGCTEAKELVVDLSAPARKGL
jgi:hypothetical protein